MNTRRTNDVAGLCCALITLLILSCSTKVTHIEVDPDFTPNNVKEKGLAILGCTSIVADSLDAFDLSNRLSTDLRNALVKEQKGLDVLPWGDVRRQLGDSKMGECLRIVHDYGTLDSATLDSLAGRLGGEARYVVVHRIESDQLSFDKSEKTETKEGKTEVTGYELKTTRTLSVIFSVYDLERVTRVWEAAIEGKQVTKRSVSTTEGLDIGGVLGTALEVASALDDIFGDDNENPYPEPASQVKVMRPVYQEFAERLLEEKK